MFNDKYHSMYELYFTPEQQESFSLEIFSSITLLSSFTIELPVIQSHPSILDVILNNPVTLPCRAIGSPRPTITWQKEGINIPTTGNFILSR